MDRHGHEAIKSAVEPAFNVNPMPDGKENSRFITIQASDNEHDALLNALHEARLMKTRGASDLGIARGPQLEVVIGTAEQVTFEDLNSR